MRDIILLGIVTIAALAGIMRPSIGLLAYVFLGVFAPQSFTWGFARTMPFSQMVAASTLVGTFISSERKAFPLHRELFLLILFWGFMGISTMFALYPDTALEKYVYVSKIFLMIILTIVLINTSEKLHLLVSVIGLSLGFYGLKGGIFAVATGGGMIVYGPENSFLYANNSIGLALAMNIPILIYLLKNAQAQWLRLSIKAMLLFSYPAIICTYSRGAWIGMLAATALSVLKSKNKFLMVGVVGALTMVLVSVAPMIAPQHLVQRYDDLVNYEQETSAQSRFWNWEFCRRVGFARPLVGGGFDYYTLESYDKFYPEFQDRWPGKVWSCHSTWLTIFGEQGMPGSIIWLSLLLCCFRSLTRLRSENYAGKEHVVDFVDMTKSALVVYLVVGTFIDAAYFDLLYYFIAFIVIVKGLRRREEIKPFVIGSKNIVPHATRIPNFSQA